MGKRSRATAGITLKIPIILNLMAKHQLNNVGLAKKTGLSSAYIGQILNSKRAPSLINLGKIAEALEVEPYHIAEGLAPY